MRTVLVSLALASAALVAAPSAAQGYHGGHGYRGGHQVHHQIQRDIDRLENRIHRSADRGRLSHREAISLSRQANRLRRDYYRFAHNGLDRRELRQLSVRLDRVQARLRYERQDADRYRG